MKLTSSIIHTAGGSIIAGTLPDKYIPGEISKNVAIVAMVQTKQLTLSTVADSPGQNEDKFEQLWDLETQGTRE